MKNVWLLALALSYPAFGAVNLLDKDDWKIDMGGFVETDLFYDSTRSFTEVIGNNPVVRPGTDPAAPKNNPPDTDQHGRTQMSVRNSRLSFNVQAPAMEEWKSRGYYEFDLLGYEASPGAGSNSEGSYFNNPTMRVRHIYISTEKNNWQFLTGQTWNLLGWQPYYFIPTIQVAPIPGMLYGRTGQIRAVKTLELNESNKLQAALGIFRPPQRDGRYPALEGGLRWAMSSWSAAFTGGATGSHKPQPLSVGVSGTVRNFDIPQDPSGATTLNTTSYMGRAVSVDMLIPIIPASEGKDTSNNLVIGGEFSIGEGYGDEFSGWSGGQKNPISGLASGLTYGPEKTTNLDAGIGGYDSQATDGSANFGLIKLQTMNLYAQYHLPERMHTWVAAGYSQLSSANITAFQYTAAMTASGYGKEEAIFANVSHDCSAQIRTGIEWARIKTTYSDTTVATDDRLQYSAWFIF